MRRDRTGEPIDDAVADIDDQDVHDIARCSGWIDRDRGVPCLTCRPWHRHEPPDPPASAETIAAAREHLRDVLGWPT